MYYYTPTIRIIFIHLSSPFAYVFKSQYYISNVYMFTSHIWRHSGVEYLTF